MNDTVAIIGSGPTGIYTLTGLLAAARPLSITIFEVEPDPGKGTPYHPHVNDQAMLANIASFELPPVYETLVEWLRRQPDERLQELNISRDNIDAREFYPRVVLGAYLQSQFRQAVEKGLQAGHVIDVKPLHRVVDISLRADDIQLTVRGPDGGAKDYAFHHVVMATGHNWPEITETRPGYFVSPWPAPVLKKIGAGSIGILGTSLSAIDALITVATAHGAFYLDPAGQLQYRVSDGSEALQFTLMSRKGLLPEADFYFDYPHSPLRFCTPAAIDALIARGSLNLLDDVFELFRRELVASDESYAAKIGLALLTIESFAPAYFSEREAADPFVWAAYNLAQAEQNKVNRYTVPWRYAILRMHEVIARAVPHLDAGDLERFHRYFKSIFVDDYATVPHQSIHRLLALRRAGRIRIIALGNDYDIGSENVAMGAEVRHPGGIARFDAFIDATGQPSMSVQDLPFPSLLAQGALKAAATPQDVDVATGASAEAFTRTGGIDLDAAFRPKFVDNLCRNLYCAAIAFLLHKLPFVQGITSAHEIGGIVAAAIRHAVEAEDQAIAPARAPVRALTRDLPRAALLSLP